MVVLVILIWYGIYTPSEKSQVLLLHIIFVYLIMIYDKLEERG